MTAQVQFFCSPKEEQSVLEYLLHPPSPLVFQLDGRRIRELPDFSPKEMPTWPDYVCLYFWAIEYGPLQWHESRPKVEGPTPSSFVARLFAREDWDELKIVEGDGLLNQDISPAICYKRPEQMDGKTGPCTLIAPPSNLERVGVEYAKWVNRCISWVRRQGTKVHDWKQPSTSIPNPHSFLSTVYAFPDAAVQLKSGHHSFVIL